MPIRIDTAAIESAAGTISKLNSQLEATLQESQRNVQSLSNVWSGPAAEATIGSYNGFAAKYFANYKQLLEDYVVFLRQVAAGNYSEAETQNVNLSEMLP